jgi:tetratricopeptide (TPR) repeat protein
LRRKLDQLKEALREHASQRESLLLVVSCTDLDVIYTLKTLEALDTETPSDIFLVFDAPFIDAPGYATAVLESLRVQMEGAASALAEQKEAPFPPLPALCADIEAPATARLRAAVDHVATLVPLGADHHVIWAFFPLQIADQEGYARLVAEFIPWRGPEPWMKGLRVVARDDRARPFLSPELRKREAPGVLLFESDMSPAALNDALVKEASDRGARVADRMQALVQLAGLDYAHRRYPQAIEKYTRLHGYYAEHRAPVMQAMMLQGVGDVLRRMGDPTAARVKYHQGLTLAMETQALPVLLSLTYSIGEVSLEIEDYPDAEGFFALAEQLAGKLMNPFVKAEAMEKQGIARYRRGDEAGAVVVWRGVDELCKTFGYHERRRAVLERLIAAYKSMHLDAERRACEVELEAEVQAIKAAAKADHEHPLRANS